MTTPTPSGTHGSKRPLNAFQSTATPPAQPLLGQFTSPAPRSVPSPAAHRTGQQAGKSPFAASHAPSVGSTATAAGALNHPTGSSSGKAAGAGTGGLLGSSPAPLGMDSPAGLGLGGLGALAGVEMGITASQLGSMGLGLTSGGISLGAGARAMDDEERRRRLEAVIRLVGQAPGRASDEGIERLAKRYGLDVECTPPMGQSKPDGRRQISLAGETFIIDLGSKDDAVQSVQWEGAENAFSETAAALLKKNLTPPEGASKINHTLDKFAQNLERLARLDKLEGPNFNCFEAIGGVYASLKKLYEHERNAAIELLGVTGSSGNETQTSSRDQRAESEVMCKKSGKPMLNARGRVGLTIEYWMDNRHTSVTTSDPDAMDTDESSSPEDDSEDSDGIYSLLIDCDSPAKPYDSIRNSSSWISDAVEKAAGVAEDLFGAQQAIIDWQDPPESYLHNPNEAQPDVSVTSIGKLPNIRFVARLDPPLPLPATVVLLIKQLMLQGKPDPNPQEHEMWKHLSYDGLVLRADQLDEVTEFKDMNDAAIDHLRQTTSRREILVQSAGTGEAERLHAATLWSKPERGRVLEEVSFSHPKQIVELLPTLRQYAFFNSLLRRSFSPRSTASNGHGGGVQAALESLPVDVRLKTMAEAATNPQIEITFPLPSVPSTASATSSHKASSASAHAAPAEPVKDMAQPAASSNNANDNLSLDDLLSSPDLATTTLAPSPEMLHLTLTIEPNGAVKLDPAEQNIVPGPHAQPPQTQTTAKDSPEKVKKEARDGAEGDAGGEADGEDAKPADEGADAMEGLTKEMTKNQEKHEAQEKWRARVQRLGRALEVCEDLGVWIEWVGQETRRENVEGGKADS